MKVKNYEYIEPDMSKEITEERKEELIRKMKEKICEKKNRTHIGHYEILDIGKDELEWSFMTEWLMDNNFEIKGISPEMSGEIPNFKHILRDGKDKKLPQVLSNDEIIELFKIMETETPEMAKKARDEIIKHNLRLANLIIQWPKARRINLPEEDKKAYAWIGLINAVDNFDYRKGYKFSTYASISMFRALQRNYIKEILPYKTNQPLLDSIENIKTTEYEFMAVKGKMPTDREIAEITGYDIKRVRELREIRLRNEDLESLERRVDEKHDRERIINSFDDSVAPNVEIRGQKIRGMEKSIPDEEAYIIDGIYYEPEENNIERAKEIYTDYESTEEATNVALKEQVDRVLSTLTKREEMVIRYRFGLIDGKCLSLEEVGAIFRVTRERIRQIEAKAVRKLRHPNRSEKLKPYLEIDGQQDDGIIHFDPGTISGGIKKDFVLPKLEYIQKQADFLKYIGMDLPEEVEPKEFEKENVETGIEEVKTANSKKVFDIKTATDSDLVEELQRLIAEMDDVRKKLPDEKISAEEKKSIAIKLKEDFDEMNEINQELDSRRN